MDKLIALIRKAGEIALKEQSKMKVSVKKDTSIVTNGDLKVSKFLEKELVKLFPGHEVFSEENAGKIPKSKNVIVIDPIDGTQSYSRKQDTWSILIGFLENGQETMGVIYQPTLDILYYAKKGEGATMIQGGRSSKLTGLRSGPLKAFGSPTRTGELEFLKERGVTEIEYMYSAALKIMEIVKGNADIYPNFQMKCSIWDLIAPTVILREIGGEIVYEKKISPTFEKPSINTRFCAVGPRMKTFKF